MSRPGRAILIVLDGVGVGALPDADVYGDADAATLPHVASACGGLKLPTLERLGLGHLAEIDGVAAVESPGGAYGRLAERSPGKDSTTGHWELAGIILAQPFATYPQGFPAELVNEFTSLAGAAPLGNVPASGTSILKRYGEAHLRTGRPILYTSVDSVFQIAAHTDVLPLEELYDLCRRARRLVDGYRIGRVIARPFAGRSPADFRRLPQRKDFSIPPPGPTLLDRVAESGHAVFGVGKIHDLFAGRGVTANSATTSNADGMAETLQAWRKLDNGLLVVNLIDFDMVYGHRNDAAGFAAALEEFDGWLPRLQAEMAAEDLLLITADHGCDPTTPGTDHTREYVPLLAWRPGLTQGVDLGTRASMADVAATLDDFFALGGKGPGESFLARLI